MTTRKLIVGNWKMNGSLAANAALVQAIGQGLERAGAAVTVAVAPPSVYLAQVGGLLAAGEEEAGQCRATVALAAQDVSAAPSGAYTGDIAAAMLRELGVRYVIVGHSERRKYQGESNAVIAAKAAQAQAAGLTPIACLGETLEERDAGRALAVVQEQLQAVLEHEGVNGAALVVAYEPVWAIGTGRTASPEQAQEVHAALRAQLAAALGESAARHVAILYGGSMNAGNAAELLAKADIDGGLIGGAALKAPDFLEIIACAQRAANPA
ncbi:triose-phosphate isomerase [Corticibacter populi]|uniref:Triosephosphate isomerase n=1 Tax=Corticibacter populi TaxID=1550736 RepID=A0A3M6R075_9BURK|nr:triose-phosphate isomerase [Corticibacter populi]RMX08654.1 triose-phosphate isomerase [Corticibacter populi]RZS35989.1 triosephosphate isomerase [Corticibacter populi]